MRAVPRALLGTSGSCSGLASAVVDLVEIACCAGEDPLALGWRVVGGDLVESAEDVGGPGVVVGAEGRDLCGGVRFGGEQAHAGGPFAQPFGVAPVGHSGMVDADPLSVHP